MPLKGAKKRGYNLSIINFVEHKREKATPTKRSRATTKRFVGEKHSRLHRLSPIK